MTRHDQLVPTTAHYHRTTGWFAPSAAAIAVTLANPTNSAFSRTSNSLQRRPLGVPGTLGVTALGSDPTPSKQQNP